VRDYVKIAKAYARDAVKDTKRKKYGRYVQLAAQRFLNDLKRAKAKDGFTFNADEACAPCEFIELLPHVEGVWETPNITLHPSHVFFLVQLFGFRNRNGGRRYTSALFAVARKNAKSTLAGGILLYCLCCESEPGAQVISAATTYDQAAIIFKIAKSMAEKTPALRDAFGLKVWSKTISRPEQQSIFKAVHAKASTQDGLNPSHVSLDEIHAHKTPDLLNVLTSAAGARSNPLWLYTTTEGYTNPGPWAEIRSFAKQLLKGVFGDSADHFLALFYAVDEDDKAAGVKADEEFDESAWIKANPLIDSNPHLLDAIRKEAVEARHMPSKLAEFRIKRLNRPASAAEGWIDLGKWQACSAPVDMQKLEGVPCWGGLDLASTTDIAALRLVWQHEGVIYTAGWRWAPEGSVAYRTERATVPYAAWVESGLLKQTEGNVIDYSIIEADVVELCEQFNVQAIGYDRWNASDLVNRLTAQQVPMVEFIQGAKSFHPAMQALERDYISGKLAHAGDPILNWCASNLIARRDVNLNMAPDRKRSADKIDDLVALLMARGLMGETEAVPEDGFDDFLANPLVF